MEQLKFEQQLCQLMVDSSKLRMKLVGAEDEKAEAVRQQELAQNTKVFQHVLCDRIVSRIKVIIVASAEAIWFDALYIYCDTKLGCLDFI